MDSIFELALRVCFSVSGLCALFMGPTSTLFSKIFIKIEFHGTIHTFKNYFAAVFLVLVIDGIQIDPKKEVFIGYFEKCDHT